MAFAFVSVPTCDDSVRDRKTGSELLLPFQMAKKKPKTKFVIENEKTLAQCRGTGG